MYWVEFSKGDGPSLKYRDKGGGKYSSITEAKRKVESLRRRGNQAFLFETECEWRMVFDD